MRLIIAWLILLTTAAFSGLPANAQTCTGSLGNPVVNITFGAGADFNSTGAPLSGDVTTLHYTSSPCDEGEAYYGLAANIRGCHAGTWHVIWQDHTGDPNGYFMLINGPSVPSLVYSQKVDGSALCPNTTYEFAAWIMNVLVLTDETKNWVLPNLTFTIETTNGKVLKTVSTGDIAETEHPVWNQYGTFFTSPADGSDVYIKLYDNQPALGNGNDFAVDDITFRPCGPVIKAGFDSVSGVSDKQLCAGYDQTYTLVGTQSGYPNPVYQWQRNLSDGKGWVDIPGATDTTCTVALTAPAAAKYQYRLGVLSGNTTSVSCRIYSPVLTVGVYPFPLLTMPRTTTICQGAPLQLYIQQGESYFWTGPNGFTSTDNSPVITAAATPVYNGLYTVRVTTHGCPSFASTTVKVYPPLVGSITANVTICQGFTTTLSAEKSQGAVYYHWSPATGLSDTTGAVVYATPLKTTTYTVTIGNGGCPDISQSVIITVVKQPIVSAGSTKKITEGSSVKLNGTTNGDVISYYWTPADYLDDPASLTPIATPSDDITYTLHIISDHNCGADTSNVFVRVYKKITVPNTFSPNNDGINDVWNIKNLYTYPESSIFIYNRYGQQVFQSTGYSHPWSGKTNGIPQPVGTYYYVIDLKNGAPKVAGWVFLVR